MIVTCCYIGFKFVTNYIIGVDSVLESLIMKSEQ